MQNVIITLFNPAGEEMFSEKFIIDFLMYDFTREMLALQARFPDAVRITVDVAL